MTIRQFLNMNLLASDIDYEVEDYDSGGHTDFLTKEDVEGYCNDAEVLDKEIWEITLEDNKLIFYWRIH